MLSDSLVSVLCFLSAAMALDIVTRAAAPSGGPDQGPQLRHTTIALLVLASFFVILRFVSRYLRGVAVAFDDWITVVSLVRSKSRPSLHSVASSRFGVAPGILHRRGRYSFWE